MTNAMSDCTELRSANAVHGRDSEGQEGMAKETQHDWQRAHSRR